MDVFVENKIDELIQDDHNFNAGTYEGQILMNKSLEKFGAGRAILVDKNNRIIAGNKTALAAKLAGIENAIIVETDGKKLVVVKRTDVDLNSRTGRELALADNQTAKVNISWNKDEIISFFGDEISEWGVVLEDSLFTIDDIDVFAGDDSAVDSDYFSLHLALPIEYKEVIEKYFRIHGKKEISDILLSVCQEWWEIYNQ